jgi:hypothetical protein
MQFNHFNSTPSIQFGDAVVQLHGLNSTQRESKIDAVELIATLSVCKPATQMSLYHVVASYACN